MVGDPRKRKSNRYLFVMWEALKRGVLGGGLSDPSRTVVHMTTTPTSPASSPVLSAREVRECLDRVGADLARLNAAIIDGALWDVADAALPTVALDLLAMSDRAQAAATVTVGRVHSSGVLRAEGFVSTKRWLVSQGRLAERDAAMVLARSKDLASEFVATQNSWLAGEITGRHVQAITLGIKDAVSNLEEALRDQLRAAGEAQLIDIARDHDPDAVKRAATRLRNAARPDGAKERDIDAYDSQTIRLTAVGDGFTVKGFLDTEAGAALTLVLDRIIDSWHRDGSLAPPPVIDPVTGQIDVAATAALVDKLAARPGRRDHLAALALGHLVTQWLGSGGGGSAHQVKAHLHLHADLTDLIAGTGSGELSIPGSDRTVPVTMSTVARIGCDADVTAILERLNGGADQLVPCDGNLLSATAKELQDRSREILWLGREHRHVNARLWNAIVARDGHCQFPGCHADPTRGNPHHVVPWWAGGKTDPDNLILLCAQHHRVIHAGNWSITPTPGRTPLEYGYWTIRPPARSRT